MVDIRMQSVGYIVSCFIFLRTISCTYSCNFTVFYNEEQTFTVTARHNISIRSVICPCTLASIKQGNIKVLTSLAFQQGLVSQCATMSLRYRDKKLINANGNTIGPVKIDMSTPIDICFVNGMMDSYLKITENSLGINCTDLLITSQSPQGHMTTALVNTKTRIFTTLTKSRTFSTSTVTSKSTEINNASPITLRVTSQVTQSHNLSQPIVGNGVVETVDSAGISTTTTTVVYYKTKDDQRRLIEGQTKYRINQVLDSNYTDNVTKVDVILPVTASSVIVVAVIIGLLVYFRKRRTRTSKMRVAKLMTRPQPIPSTSGLVDSAENREDFEYGLRDNVLYNSADIIDDIDYTTSSLDNFIDSHYQDLNDFDTEESHAKDEYVNASASTTTDFPIYAKVNKIKKDTT